MRTLVGSSLLGVSLVGSALAQQHPWLPGCMDAGGCGFTGVPLDGQAGAMDVPEKAASRAIPDRE